MGKGKCRGGSDECLTLSQERQTPHCKVYETEGTAVSAEGFQTYRLFRDLLWEKKEKKLGSSDMLEGVQKRILSFLPCKHCSSLPNTGSHFCEYFGVECFVMLLYISVVNRFENHFPTDWGSELGSLWGMEAPAYAPIHSQCLCKHSLLNQSQSPGSSSILRQEPSIELIPSSTTTPQPCTAKIKLEIHLHIPFSFPKPPPLHQFVFPRTCHLQHLLLFPCFCTRLPSPQESLLSG